MLPSATLAVVTDPALKCSVDIWPALTLTPETPPVDTVSSVVSACTILADNVSVPSTVATVRSIAGESLCWCTGTITLLPKATSLLLIGGIFKFVVVYWYYNTVDISQESLNTDHMSEQSIDPSVLENNSYIPNIYSSQPTYDDSNIYTNNVDDDVR